MKFPNFLTLHLGFVICFTCGIYGWQATNGWVSYFLMGNAIALFAIHLIMAIYYIGGGVMSEVKYFCKAGFGLLVENE